MQLLFMIYKYNMLMLVYYFLGYNLIVLALRMFHYFFEREIYHSKKFYVDSTMFIY